ncbi:MAG: Zn-ribbon domain-containing OB-fold protein [Candidatus Kapabacteria bacterium]|nr:Zn-ribbon domain-containing OB-fold protein [Candidatus Kapabacteria bacterium]
MADSARYHREKFHRYILEAQKFDSGFVSLPNRYVDPYSGSRSYEKINLKGTGTILSYTIIHIASDQFAHTTPFPVAIIETDEGARLTVMVTDCDINDVKIGARVELVFRKIMEEGESGIINYGYKAILI